jgi:hypothetical protein
MKKITFFSSIALISSLLWLGCSKEEDTLKTTVFKGKILEENSRTPVADARVIFYETLYSKTFGGGSITINLDTAFTDKEGNFSFDYTPSKGSSTELSVTASKKNYETTNAFTLSSTDSEVFITPYAWVKIRIVNVPPIEQSDWLTVWGWLRNGTHETEDFGITGKCDTAFTQKVLGNRKNWVAYTLSSSIKPKFQKIDTLYCKGLDTTFYQILY